MMRIRACLTRLLAGIVLAGVAPAGPLAAQSPDDLVARGVAAGADAELLQELRARAGRAGLEEAATVRMLGTAVAAAEAGLPSRMLLQKGLEGLSKGVAPDRIAAVMSSLQGAVARAGGLVDPWLERPGVREALAPSPAGPEEGDGARGTLVESVGLALEGGASEGAVRELLDRVPGRLRARRVSALRLGVAVEVLPELPVAARNPRVAADLVVEALDSGFGAAELRELPAALQAAARRGQLPAAAVARGAMAQMRGDLPAATVLQNLFQGDFPGNAPFELPPGLEKARERGKDKGRERGPPP